MSLIETMITLGVASGLVLAVMEAAQMATKQVKSASLSNDWTTLVSNIRLMLQDSNQCTCFLKDNFSSTYPTLAAGTALPGSPLSQIYLYNPTMSCTRVGTLFGPTGSIVPVSIDVKVTTGNVTKTIPGASQYIDYLELDLVGRKVLGAASGSSAGAQYLYATNAYQKNSGIVFQVVRDASTGAFQSCYSVTDQAKEACYLLGGTIGPSGTDPQCQLENIQLTRSGNPSTSGVYGPPTGTSGQKIQLRRANGAFKPPAVGDTAIGVDSDKMWFNAGGPTDGFAFYTNSGASLVATLYGPVGASAGLAVTGMITGSSGITAASTIRSNAAAGVDAFHAASGIIRSRATSGQAIVADNGGYIESDAASNTKAFFSPSGQFQSDADLASNAFYAVNGKLFVGGQSDIGYNSGSNVSINFKGGGKIDFGGSVSGAARTGTETHTVSTLNYDIMSGFTINTNGGAGFISAPGNMWVQSTTGNARLASTGATVTVSSGTAMSISAGTTMTFSGTETHNGEVNLTNLGGNVPFACRSVTNSGASIATVSCAAGFNVVSGGCFCTTAGANLNFCAPLLPVAANPLTNTDWKAACSGGSMANVWAVCCKF